MINIETKRRTKIIWSFESKVLTPQLAQMVVKEDFDCLRLVYQPNSAQTIVDFLDALERFRDPEKVIPIMVDAPPQVRGLVSPDAPVTELKYGQTITLAPKGKKADLNIDSNQWSTFFQKGSTIYFGYGNVTLQTITAEKDLVEAQVIQGGAVYPGMEIHVPSTRPDPKLAEFDLADLKKLLSRQIDYFVLPGFSHIKELREMREFVEQNSKIKPWFILKLNSQKVYEKLEGLMEHADGVLISRLELALFMEPAIIPVITKEVIQLGSNAAKIVFTASEMLGSMRTNPTPTRAEVSDIANAVIDGTDAVVLSEDVPFGPYSTKAVRLMARAIDDIEKRHETAPNWARLDPDVEVEMDAVAFTAYKTARRVNAKAIVCLTHAGNTAIKLSSFRTDKPILAVTFSKDVLRRLSLVRGVTGILLEADPVIDQVLPVVNDLLKKTSWLQPKDRIVFVSVTLSPLGQTESNLFTVQTVS